MKRFLAIIVILLLICGAALCEQPAPDAAAAAEPAGTAFSCELLSCTLPEGLKLLEGESLAGYEAAVKDLYSGAGETLLAAVSDDNAKAVCISAEESSVSAADAAAEAAASILGAATYASEADYGENHFGTFACTVSGSRFDFFFAKIGEKLVTVSLSGLSAQEVSDLLSSVKAI